MLFQKLATHHCESLPCHGPEGDLVTSWMTRLRHVCLPQLGHNKWHDLSKLCLRESLERSCYYTVSYYPVTTLWGSPKAHLEGPCEDELRLQASAARREWMLLQMSDFPNEFTPPRHPSLESSSWRPWHPQRRTELTVSCPNSQTRDPMNLNEWCFMPQSLGVICYIAWYLSHLLSRIIW